MNAVLHHYAAANGQHRGATSGSPVVENFFLLNELQSGSIPTAQSLRRQDTLESWRTPVVKPQERVDEPSPKPPAVVMNSGVQPMVFNHCQVTIVQAAAEDEKEEENPGNMHGPRSAPVTTRALENGIPTSRMWDLCKLAHLNQRIDTGGGM